VEANSKWKNELLRGTILYSLTIRMLTLFKVRQAMQIIIPLVLALNHYALNVCAEAACIATGMWVYNELKMGDEGWIQRNKIIALGFGVFNWSSLKVAIGAGANTSPETSITSDGLRWIYIVSAIILTTMHIQDLKDVVGDRAKGRKTAPLVLGEQPARWTLVISIILWGPFCAVYWRKPCIGLIAVLFGTFIAWRCVLYKGNKEDRKTWQLWCAWTALLSLMPVAS
jgi:4-hydroxybenzoate polyprenyltransferase